MQLDIDKEIALLQRMTVGQLREKYEETWSEPTNTRTTSNGSLNVSLGRCRPISEATFHSVVDNAAELARGTGIRTTAPNALKPISKPTGDTMTGFVQPEEDNRLPPPRSEIERVYKGEKIVVLVLDNGFEYEGAVYKTLSAVAKKITGQHCNGYHFFKLNKAVSQQQEQRHSRSKWSISTEDGEGGKRAEDFQVALAVQHRHLDSDICRGIGVTFRVSDCLESFPASTATYDCSIWNGCASAD